MTSLPGLLQARRGVFQTTDDDRRHRAKQYCRGGPVIKIKQINKSRTTPKQNGIMSATIILIFSYLPLRCTMATCPIFRLCPNFSSQSLYPSQRWKNCFQMEYRPCWDVCWVVVVEHLSEDDVECWGVVVMTAGIAVARTTAQVTAIRLQLIINRTHFLRQLVWG